MQNPSPKKTLTYISLLIVLALAFYNTKDFLLGAPLSIKTAKDGATVSDAFLSISGSAKHASILKINGRVVPIEKNGEFSDGALLSPGYNIIEVAMEDKFGKEKRKVFHLVAEPSSTVATSLKIDYQ